MRTRTILFAAPLFLLLLLGLAFLELRAHSALFVERTPEPGSDPKTSVTYGFEGFPESVPPTNPNPASERARAAFDPVVPLPPGHPLRGRLVDERTGEAVPDFPLVVRRAENDSGEDLVSDADGRFRTRAPQLPGAFEFGWIDPSAERADYEPSEYTLVALDLEHEFRLRIGPTYQLDLRLPAALAVADLRGALSSLAEHDLVARRFSTFTRLRAPAARNPALPWVRFHPDSVFGADSGGPWILDVTSEDGVWSGSAEVRSIVGRYPEVVALDLTPRTVLRGWVRDERGLPVVDAFARIEREEGGDRHQMWSLTGGEYRFRALAPGRWRLEIDSYVHATHVVTLDLPAGRESVHDATLVALESAGSVSGVVTSATGTWHGEALVGLWGHAGTKSNRRSPAKWTQEEGRWIHRFAFEGVPAGTYLLEWVSRGCPFEVHPSPKQLVTVPARGLEFRVQDDAPVGQVVFRARDSATGQELPAFDLWWMSLDGWAEWRRGLASGAVAIEGWPLNRELLWALRAPSGAMVAGDARQLMREGKRLVADVAVDAGFGVQFFVVDTKHEALPGLRLAFDGAEVPASGALGRLPVSLPHRPKKIEVLTPGWRIAGGSDDPAVIGLDESNWWALEIVLEKTPR